MNTHYFIHFSYSTATKNTLQNQAHDFLKSLDGKLVTIKDLEATTNLIVQHIEHLNQQNPRCKPLKVSFNCHNTSRPFSLSGFEAVVFHLRPATLIHVSSLIPTV